MLNETQTLVRDAARAIAQKELAPGAAERDRSEEFPHDGFKALAGAGLMGILVDEKYGGSGADFVSFSQAVTEVAKADGGFSTAMQVHNGIVCLSIQNFGNAEQKAKYLTLLAKGADLGCFCLTEPGTGSDASAIKMRAEKRGNQYILNGSKQFITCGGRASVAIVIAVTDPSDRKNGLSAFIVPTKTEGYSVGRVERTMGQRSTDHCHVIFDDCAIDEANLLGKEGEGLKVALSGLAIGRIGVAAQANGMAQAAYERALQYAQERETFGQKIIKHQAVGFRLADMATSLEAAKLMVWKAASLRDAGQPCLKESSMAKLFAADVAEQVCNDAIQTLGGYGYLEDYELERIYRDVRVCKIYEGTADIQRIVISREIAD